MDVATARWVEATTARIQTRAAAALEDAMARDPTAPTLGPKRRKRAARRSRWDAIPAELRDNTLHDITVRKNIAYCSRCRTSAGPARWRDWLAGMCVDVAANGNLPGEIITNKNQQVHPSHSMRYYDHVDLHACTRCGLYTSQLVKNLVKPCAGVPSKAGRENLARLRRLLMPGQTRRAEAYNAEHIKRRKTSRGSPTLASPPAPAILRRPAPEPAARGPGRPLPAAKRMRTAEPNPPDHDSMKRNPDTAFYDPDSTAAEAASSSSSAAKRTRTTHDRSSC